MRKHPFNVRKKTAHALQALFFICTIGGLQCCKAETRAESCDFSIERKAALASFVVENDPECGKRTVLGQAYESNLLFKDEQIPFLISIPESVDQIKTVIVYIAGGPGTKISDGFEFDSGINSFIRNVSQRCKSIILVPAYSGTHDRSRYPNESIGDAVFELEFFLLEIERRYKNKNIIIISESLGSYLFSISKKSKFDIHFSIVPAMRSPDDFMKIGIKNTKSNGQEAILQNTWRKYRIGKNRDIKELRLVDFVEKFFGNSPYRSVDFIEGWNAHFDADNHKLNSMIFLKNEDQEAGGGVEYNEKLQNDGFKSYSLPFSSHTLSLNDVSMIDSLIDENLSDVCNQ